MLRYLFWYISMNRISTCIIESVCITCMYFFGVFIFLCLWMSHFACLRVFFPLFICMYMLYCLSKPSMLEWWFHCLHVYTFIYLEELLVLSWVLFSIPSLFALCVYSLSILVYGYCLLVCVRMYSLLYLYEYYSLVF